MLEFHASDFVALSQSLQAVRMALIHCRTAAETLSEPSEELTGVARFLFSKLDVELRSSKERLRIGHDEMRAAVNSSLQLAFTGMTKELERLGLLFSLTEVERVQARFVESNELPSEEAIDGISVRIRDELDENLFFQVSKDQIEYYDPSEPLFGADVESKFPMMSEDIAEAGKCMALDRGTAAVFHLMRVMEIAVQRFGEKLGIALVHEKNWQPILDEMNKAIRGLDQRAIQTKSYAAATAHLYNVKLCWRNEVMHPKQTYTEQEARALFSAVEVFIRDLAVVL